IRRRKSNSASPHALASLFISCGTMGRDLTPHLSQNSLGHSSACTLRLNFLESELVWPQCSGSSTDMEDVSGLKVQSKKVRHFISQFQSRKALSKTSTKRTT